MHGFGTAWLPAGHWINSFAILSPVSAARSSSHRPTYYRANRDPSTRGETTARLFLGTRLQCAKCHNHPFDRWTQDDYYQWSSLFSQIDYELGENKRRDKLDKNEFVGDQVVLIAKKDEVSNPTDRTTWPDPSSSEGTK